jgi:hypothetical protein
VPKAKILARLTADRIPAAVPPDYLDVVRLVIKAEVVYTLVLFSHDREKGVVTSAAVRRAFSRIKPEENILAIGANFTQEAEVLLNERKAAIARLGDVFWTDESYQSLPR